MIETLYAAAIPAEFLPYAPAAPHGGFVLADIHLAGGRIDSVQPVSARAEEKAAGFDCRGRIVLPGFIDVHVHGADGADVMDASPAALDKIAAFKARHGVTGFYATTMTASPAATLAAVRAVNDYAGQHSPAPGARILGIHLEGPFISPHFPGAQNPNDIRPPDPAEFRQLVDSGPVAMITLAPEVEGASEVIAVAGDRGVVAVLGHTNATYEECVAAVAQGVAQATHTYNAMSGLHHRRPGTLGAVLRLDALHAQLIADNIHVHPAAMEILARCKGPDRLILITDAMRAAGLPDGHYELGGLPVTVTEGQCRLEDGTLAGSVLTMERALANFMAATGWSAAQAWPCTSRTPARALGIADRFGTLAPGTAADMVVLEDDLSVAATIVGGAVVYRKRATAA